MMDPQLEARLANLEKKLDAIYVSTEKTRWYMQMAALVTVAAVVLPLIGLVFAIPTLLSTYSSIANI